MLAIAGSTPVPQGDHFGGAGIVICAKIARQTKVAQLELASIGQQQVGHFEVAVHDPGLVQVRHCPQQLHAHMPASCDHMHAFDHMHACIMAPCLHACPMWLPARALSSTAGSMSQARTPNLSEQSS